MKHVSLISSALLLAALCVGCSTAHRTTNRDIPNFYTVSPGIYRGAQPTAEGWKYLQSIGVRCVIKLNTEQEGSDAFAEKLNMEVIRIPITTAQQTVDRPSVSALRRGLMRVTTNGTYIHCGSNLRTSSKIYRLLDAQGGQDRTGLFIGLYRVKAQGIPKQAAYAEMKAYGFHPLLRGLYSVWEDEP